MGPMPAGSEEYESIRFLLQAKSWSKVKVIPGYPSCCEKCLNISLSSTVSPALEGKDLLNHFHISNA